MELTLLLLAGLGLAVLVPNLLDDDEEDNETEGEQGVVVNGTDGPDNIRTFGGDDTINAGAGEDFVNAGLGDDTVRGGDDRDIIEGRAGDDRLFGENGSDTIEGGLGDDFIDGGRGFDILRGGRGDDDIFGGPRAQLVGGELVTENEQGDIARGNEGDDDVYIWGGQGEAFGGEGNDRLILVTGQGTLTDEFAEPTEHYVLANDGDGGVLTRGTITEFGPGDSLTLTIDGDLAGGAAPEVTFELDDTPPRNGPNMGVNGVTVRAIYVDDGDAIDGSEAASVFLRGATIAGLAGADINVVFTDNADYFDPESTLRAIGVTV